jgi:dephospho-CoA kinase
MILVGLTGSIAMGKSTVSRMFEDAGWPVFDSDAAVHEFYRSEGARRVEAAFPGVLVDGEIDRKRLSAQVLGNEEAIRRLEAIVHPEVGRLRSGFRERAAVERRRGIVYDVPLLFETGGERNCDVVVVVSASAASQRARALARPGMSAEKFDAMLGRQTPDAEKRRRAHYVIDTERTLEDTRRQVQDLIRALIGAPGRTKL